MKLTCLGWNDFFANHAKDYQDNGCTFGRVAVRHRNSYLVYFEHGELSAEITGKMRHQAKSNEDLPAVGDWVLMRIAASEDKAMIHQVLPRKSKFSRKIVGGTTEEQIIATNIDTVFLVMGLDQDLNLRRLERYLLSTWESGSNAVIVLNKTDLCANVSQRVAEVETVAMGVPILAVSAAHSDGTDKLASFVTLGQTVALLGSSGVGKSTLVNCLLGEDKQRVQEVRGFKDRGKHTTSHRELFILPQGGLIIDTPGMRELQVWGTDKSLQGAFDDIESLTSLCRFRDCRHMDEPQCAVQEAIKDGSLDEERLHNYQKMQKEIAYLERKKDYRARMQEKEKWRKITKMARKRKKMM